MLILFISIIVIYILTILYNLLIGRPKICPICAGVAGTWLWLLAIYFVRPELIQPLWLGILMGGSVVGIMYQLDKKISGQPVWLVIKPFWVAIGFGLVNAIIHQSWSWAFLAALILVIFGLTLTMTYFSKYPHRSKILERLKNCC